MINHIIINYMINHIYSFICKIKTNILNIDKFQFLEIQMYIIVSLLFKYLYPVWRHI